MANLKSPQEIIKENFSGKKVLILGLGVNQGGIGATKFFVSNGSKVKVTDIKDQDTLASSLRELEEYAGIEYTLGEHKYEDIDWADLIIKNPAIKPDNPYLLYAQKHNKQVEMDMGIFLQIASQTQIIGITGTKGKSTTSSLIYEILKKSDEKVIFAGNIGKSVLDTIPLVKPDSTIILELSSFQLEAFEQHKISPHVAVITNIYPDHLNYYGTIEQYVESKKIIAKEQALSDFLVLKKDDPVTSMPNFQNGISSQIIYFSPEDLPSDFTLKLPGEYNLWNAAAALKVAEIYGIEKADALEVIKDFNGVEYRLQLIKEINGIKIYNDSASTMPESAIWAIKSLQQSILICGGMNKNLDYQELAKVITTNAKMIFFVDGDATDEIKKHLSLIDPKSSDKIKGTYSDLEKLLTDVKAVAQPGDTILFSPGATSFNFFQNEFDRARKFNEAVTKIFG
ncbi:MAG: UDP-N-acetylmuramoyl-L-alanine--D-glutamate ligase [Candidatus Daviesbacteria bacterium]|nr:UDP-N-acetylmuramoyl-L-alanine--D-glutamate ligase [Candidatus Daviesbacteria bacterium]